MELEEMRIGYFWVCLVISMNFLAHDDFVLAIIWVMIGFAYIATQTWREFI